MYRRSLLVALFATVAGCTGSGDIGGGSGGEGSGDGSETIASETLYTDTDYPVDLSPEEVLQFDVDVVKGGPTVVVISSQSAGESVVQKRVDTHTEFEYTVENNGTHMIHVTNVDEVEFTVTKPS